jgi:hypothetical protein
VKAFAAPPPVRLTEKRFQSAVVSLAQQFGYLSYHSWLSVRSSPGFPDLVLCRPATARTPGRLVFVECKAQGKAPTPAQERWLDALRSTGVEAYLWHADMSLQDIGELLMQDAA